MGAVGAMSAEILSPAGAAPMTEAVASIVTAVVVPSGSTPVWLGSRTFCIGRP